jgi:2-succinyl-5-enolpyruvyl-6-hydroxy-3-cyclohexene-1-carboxylate synthase
MPANPSHALATVLADELARCGLTDVCLAPGSRSAALALAFADDPRIRVHVRVDERSVAFLALGIGRAAGAPAAVVTTSGTATANLHPAVAEADAARIPLLVLTADRPPEMRQTSANQTIDQLRLYGHAVRFFAEVGVPEDRTASNPYWRSLACRAWAEATGAGGPAGPVHLNLAFREPLVPQETDRRGATEGAFRSPTSGRPGGLPWTRVDEGDRRAPRDVLDRLADEAGATERGLLVLGAVPASAQVELAAAATAFAEASGWPILAEPLSGVRRGSNAIASYDALLGHPPFAEQHRPDLVIRVGRANLSRRLLTLLGPDVPQVLIDRDGAWLDPERTLREVVVAHPGRTLTSLATRLQPRPLSGWLRSWREADQAARAAIDRVLDAADAPNEPRTARDVAGAVPDGGRLVIGSSMPVRDLDAFMRPRDHLCVVGNRGASGIDGFVSTAVGVAIADDLPTVALAGDLSLLHDVNGLLTDTDPDLVLAVVNNDGGGIFSFLPQADLPSHFEPLFGTPHGVDLATVAETYRVGHELVARADDLVPAVTRALEDGGIRLVEVRTHRDENVGLHRQVRNEVARALGARGGGADSATS